MITYDLFSYRDAGSASCSEIKIPDAEIFLYPSLLSYYEADNLFDNLKTSIIWEKHKINLYGGVHDVPRLTAWYGDSNKSYVYSGIKLKTRLWNSALLKIREKIETISKTKFAHTLVTRFPEGPQVPAMWGRCANVVISLIACQKHTRRGTKRRWRDVRGH